MNEAQKEFAYQLFQLGLDAQCVLLRLEGQITKAELESVREEFVRDQLELRTGLDVAFRRARGLD